MSRTIGNIVGDRDGLRSTLDCHTVPQTGRGHHLLTLQGRTADEKASSGELSDLR